METRKNTIRFRVSDEEARVISYLCHGSEILSQTARRVLLDAARQNEDPMKRKIILLNARIKGIDDKLNELAVERSILVGHIEKETEGEKK